MFPLYICLLSNQIDCGAFSGIESKTVALWSRATGKAAGQRQATLGKSLGTLEERASHVFTMAMAALFFASLAGYIFIS